MAVWRWKSTGFRKIAEKVDRTEHSRRVMPSRRMYVRTVARKDTGHVIVELPEEARTMLSGKVMEARRARKVMAKMLVRHSELSRR